MALADCVREVLCGLSAATRNALVGIIRGYVTALEAEKAILQAKLLKLNILTLPVSALNSVAQSALAQARAGANIVPLDLIGTCVDVGNLNDVITRNIEIVTRELNKIATDLERLLSFADEINAAIDDIDAVLQTYIEVIEFIDTCKDDPFANLNL